MPKEPRLHFIFFAGGQIKTEGEVRVAIESYFDKKGVLSHEANFCDFSERGISGFRQARTLATFSQWKYKVPLDDLRQYCVAKNIDVAISIDGSGWKALLVDRATRTNSTKSDNDLELAMTLAITDIETLNSNLRKKAGPFGRNPNPYEDEYELPWKRKHG